MCKRLLRFVLVKVGMAACLIASDVDKLSEDFTTKAKVTKTKTSHYGLMEAVNFRLYHKDPNELPANCEVKKLFGSFKNWYDNKKEESHIIDITQLKAREIAILYSLIGSCMFKKLEGLISSSDQSQLTTRPKDFELKDNKGVVYFQWSTRGQSFEWQSKGNPQVKISQKEFRYFNSNPSRNQQGNACLACKNTPTYDSLKEDSFWKELDITLPIEISRRLVCKDDDCGSALPVGVAFHFFRKNTQLTNKDREDKIKALLTGDVRTRKKTAEDSLPPQIDHDSLKQEIINEISLWEGNVSDGDEDSKKTKRGSDIDSLLNVGNLQSKLLKVDKIKGSF